LIYSWKFYKSIKPSANEKKPGSRGGKAHRDKVQERVDQLVAEGYRHEGGGKEKEETVRIKNGYKSARRPDITTIAPDGSKYRENIGNR